MKPPHNSNDYDDVMRYEHAVSRLPVGALSLGSFIHDDLKLTPKAPFIGPIRQSCLSELHESSEVIPTKPSTHSQRTTRR